MNNLLQKRLAGLLCVKSIVTLIMAAAFAFSVLTDRISGEDFLTIFSVIIAFYFGTPERTAQRHAGQRAGWLSALSHPGKQKTGPPQGGPVFLCV